METLEYVFDIIGFKFYILFDHVSIAFELSICWKNVFFDWAMLHTIDLDSRFLAPFCPVLWFFMIVSTFWGIIWGYFWSAFLTFQSVYFIRQSLKLLVLLAVDLS